LDTQHSPGVGVNPVPWSSLVEQALIRGGGLCVPASPKYDGSLVLGRFLAAVILETTWALVAVHGVQAIRQ
jgi:hypothetical protein